MRNQLFVANFLFDFYSDSGSIGTPCALSNLSWAGLGKYRAKSVFTYKEASLSTPLFRVEHRSVIKI